MFTGIIENTGRIVEINKSAPYTSIWIATPFKKGEIQKGGSISVNGVCLTAEDITDGYMRASISKETLDRTTFPFAKIGDVVNLELPLTLNTPLGGHLIQGHIDGIGEIDAIIAEGSGKTIMRFKVGKEIHSHLIEKGSIAIDGISLTISRIEKTRFEVALIPHTLLKSNLPFRQIEDKVNIELDIIGKYVRRYVEMMMGRDNRPLKGGLTEDFLRKAGF